METKGTEIENKGTTAVWDKVKGKMSLRRWCLRMRRGQQCKWLGSEHWGGQNNEYEGPEVEMRSDF